MRTQLRRAELLAFPRRVYSQTMGHHDADPAEHRRYTGVVLLSVVVLAMLTVAALALTAFSHG
jgi:hypothetical protein